MKRISITLFICLILFSGLSGVTFMQQFEIKNYYDNNILKLSDGTLGEFEQGGNSQKFELESSDDLITALKMDLGIKHYYFQGHTQILRFVVSYNKYWTNGIKDELNFRLSLQQYLSKRINFRFNYYYYPEIYSNRYKSVLDNEYHSYTYSKNVYNLLFNWKVLKSLELQYKLELGQSFYNKYFTEYDAQSIESRFDLKIKLIPNLHTTLSYAFKISDADGEEAYESYASGVQYKDASYEANLFSIQFLIPKLFTLNEKSVKFRTKADLDGFYFQSDLDGDNYHVKRDDTVLNLFAGLTLPILESTDLEVFVNRDERKTSSPYSSVESDKGYCRIKSGFSLTFRF